jgi:hypothetical protein
MLHLPRTVHFLSSSTLMRSKSNLPASFQLSRGLNVARARARPGMPGASAGKSPISLCVAANIRTPKPCARDALRRAASEVGEQPSRMRQSPDRFCGSRFGRTPREIPALIMAGVQRAQSGHPVRPMAGAGRLHSMAAISALRPGRSDVAQSRLLRALQRPCIDAALRFASSGWRARQRACEERIASRTPSAVQKLHVVGSLTRF